jgi:thymidylate synthase
MSEGWAASVNLGTFDRFSDAWIACLKRVLDYGRNVMDDGAVLKEVLNITVSAWTCDDDALEAAGADPRRLRRMIEKYESLSVLPMYNVSYGKLFRKHAGVDQIDWLVRRLRLRPEAKSATIGFHTPGDELLSCISLVDCKLREGRLHLNAVFRSQNIFGSRPGNTCALRRIQSSIADDLGVPVGALTLHILSAHVYEGDLDAANRIVSSGHAGSAVNGADGRDGHDE